ncbi:MAG TPA: transcription antitermination factor NusB [Bacteroidota bacterium]|nr:transcription antitermination factor NusB [Bacteroidota bacterium]
MTEKHSTDAKTTYNRHNIREKVMQALYAFEISKSPLPHIVDTVLEDLQAHPAEYDFAKRLLMQTVSHQAEFDGIIKQKAVHWDFYRIALIDRLLLRMGICEFMYFTDIPPKVTINEAIEIAKEFSTEKSGTFLNGILDSILIDLKNSGKLDKQGRGLYDTLPPKPSSADEE